MVHLYCLVEGTYAITMTQKMSTPLAFNPPITYRWNQPVLLIVPPMYSIRKEEFVEVIKLLLLPRKNGAPTTIFCPCPIRIFPFAPFLLSRHPITQQPAKSSVRSAAQLECGILSWLEVCLPERQIGLGVAWCRMPIQIRWYLYQVVCRKGTEVRILLENGKTIKHATSENSKFGSCGSVDNCGSSAGKYLGPASCGVPNLRLGWQIRIHRQFIGSLHLKPILHAS